MVISAPRPLDLGKGQIFLLRYRADLRTIAFVAAYWGVFAFAWMSAWQPWYVTAGLVVLLAVQAWINAVITHNTLHSPMWKSRWMNRVTQVVLSCSYGFPVSEYVPGHNLSHHRFTQSRKDVMRTSKVRFEWNLLNLLLFFFMLGADVTAANFRYTKDAKERMPAWYRQLLVEMACVWGIKVFALIVDWKRALVFIGIPHLYAVWGITTVNFVQHDGCDPGHPYNHSRNYVGRIFNWFTFNNGFHGMHHLRPGLHWSLLDAAHAVELKPYIDPRLDEPSLLLYCFRTFIFPGKRLRFDGKPVVLMDEGPDEDWIGGAVQPEGIELTS